MIELSPLTRKLYALAKTIAGWASDLDKLNDERRIKVAAYLDKVADTFSRAWEALHRLSDNPGDQKQRRKAEVELGRIAGYVDTIVEVLDGQLDGRKLAGVKRRLDGIDTNIRLAQPGSNATSAILDRLNKAEGYFRALADALRT